MIVWTGDVDSVHDNVVTPQSFVRESIKVRNQVSLKPCVCRFPNQSINTLMPSGKKSNHSCNQAHVMNDFLAETACGIYLKNFRWAGERLGNTAYLLA
jgi:hypothetical protein